MIHTRLCDYYYYQIIIMCTMITGCQFTDNASLLATTRARAERALQVYMQVAGESGLFVSTPKTNVMVTGRYVTQEDKSTHVSEFPYLGAVIKSSGRMDSDIEKRIRQASKTFSSLCTFVSMDRDLMM